MKSALPTIRLHVMRLVFLLTALMVGVSSIRFLWQPGRLLDPIEGVAYSIWAAFGILAVIGVRFPQTMLPVMLLQFTYKLVWLVFIAYPLWQAGELDTSGDGLFRTQIIAIGIDLVAIPWVYVFRTYIMRMVDRTAGA